MRIFSAFILTFLIFSQIPAQYKQEEYQKYPEKKIFPKQTFDSIAARNALAYGKTTVKGVAFTKPKTSFGYKAPLADRIYANHIIVELFPLTPYFEEWYNLKKKEENLKKNIIVYMDNSAYRYRLTCETNARGEFTFPKLKPGKYVMVGTLPWSQTNSYNQYKGSGYGNYGGRTDYYEQQYYTITNSDFLMQIIEVNEGDKQKSVKLK